MNGPNDKLIRRLLALTLVLAAISAGASNILAQPAENDKKSADPAPALPLSLDLEDLLQSADLFVRDVQDPVWQLRSEQEDGLLQVRVLLEPGEAPIDINHRQLNIKGARFVAWRIVDQTNNARLGRTTPRQDVSRPHIPRWIACPQCAGAGEVEADVVKKITDRLSGDRAAESTKPCPRCAGLGRIDENAPTTGPSGDQSQPTKPKHLVLPDDAPRLARRFLLHPDGSITWRLNRLIPGAELRRAQDNLYILKLDRKALSEKNPGPAPRLERGASNNVREFAARQREARAAHQLKVKEYRKLQTAVAQASDEFGAASPQGVYAIFSLRPGVNVLTFSGPAPLPWSVPLDAFTQVRALIGARTQRHNNLDGAVIPSLQTLVKTKHPYSLQLAAQAMSQTDLLKNARPDDEIFALIKQIIDAPDDQARQIVLRRAAMTQPPTIASLTLLQYGAQRMGPRTKLIMLRSMFPGQNNNVHVDLSLAMRKAGDLLTDVNGPDPNQVLKLIMSQWSSLREDQRFALSARLPFDQAPPKRRDEVIGAVIAAASYDELAAKWLDEQLLGSQDATVQRQTLQRLSDVVIRELPAEPTPTPMQGRSVEATSISPQPTEEAPDLPPGAMVVDAPIWVESLSHSLFTLLRSPEAAQRDLAWSALGAFTFSNQRAQAHLNVMQARLRQEQLTAQRDHPSAMMFDGAPGFSNQPDLMNMDPSMMGVRTLNPSRQRSRFAGASVVDLYDRLVDAALTQKPAPRQILPFLLSEQTSTDRLSNEDHLARALVRLVIQSESDDPLSQAAAQAIPGNGVRVDHALMTMGDHARLTFAKRLYEHAPDRDPVVVGLILSDGVPNDSGLRWFGEVLAQEPQLPPTRRWIEAYRDERELQRILASDNPAAALAGAHVLVASIGGGPHMAEQLAQKVLELPDRRGQHVDEIWSSMRAGIHAQALASVAGSYTLTINLYSELIGEPQAQRAPLGQPLNPMYDPMMMQDLTARRRLRGESSPIPPDARPSKVIELGVVELKVDGQTVVFANLPINLAASPDRLGLSIETPGDLKAIGDHDLAQLPLDRVNEPLVLEPQDDKTWRGWVRLPDQRVLQMIMAAVR